MENKDRWRPRSIVFYQAYDHELMAGELISLWGAADFAVSIIVMIASSGSAISGGHYGMTLVRRTMVDFGGSCLSRRSYSNRGEVC